MIDPGCYSPWGVVQFYLSQGGYFQSFSSDCSEALRSFWEELPSIDILSYFRVLGTTCLLELPVYLLTFMSSALVFPKRCLAAVLVNLSSHPIVYFVFPELALHLNWSYVSMLVRAEVFAPVFEMFLLVYLFKLSKTRALLAALSANLFSWWVGVYLV